MGLWPSRSRGSFTSGKDPMIFIHKMRLLQREIGVILKQREEEREAYERELMVFAFKKADWRKEKKQLIEEVKRLRRKLEEKEERVREMEEEVESMAAGKSENLQGMSMSVDSSTATGATASLLLVEHMREERARRDEAVEKWKMLYLAVKHELDELIQKTHQGALYWKVGRDDTREELQRELKAKDEVIQVMKAQTASMEEEDQKRRREVDILRQSLRIICSKKGTAAPTPVVANSTIS